MRTWFLIALILLLFSCAPSRFVEPLNRGEWCIGGNFGGPVIDVAGAPVPVPLSAVEVGYGLNSNMTIHGGLHTTSILFGNAQIDAGLTYQFLDQRKYIPNLSATPGFNFIFSPGEKAANFWPVVDLNAFWNYGERRNYFYVGCNNYFELSRTMANEQKQAHHWLFSPQIGHVIKGKERSWELITEVKILAPYLESESAFVPYKSIDGKNGAIGVYLGFRKQIRKK